MKATANAGSNIAFIKYWGVREGPEGSGEPPQPLNPSLSMTLRGARTATTVEFQQHLSGDICSINNRPAPDEALKRVGRVLDEVRKRAGIARFARVASVNDFPTAAGIASSASGFAALALAAAKAADLPCDPPALVPLAILGSGSACRSLFGGFVRWDPMAGSAGETVRQLEKETHWDLADLIAVVSREEKPVPSYRGHLTARSSPLLNSRIEGIPRLLAQVEQAIHERNLAALGEAMEADALSMHSVIMSSRPPVVYWAPATISVVKRVQSLRASQGLECYFTIDAGPNVHVITLPEQVATLAQELKGVDGVLEVLPCRAGPGSSLTAEHLF